MLGQFNLGKVAFADGLEQSVFADVWFIWSAAPWGRRAPTATRALATLQHQRNLSAKHKTQRERYRVHAKIGILLLPTVVSQHRATQPQNRPSTLTFTAPDVTNQSLSNTHARARTHPSRLRLLSIHRLVGLRKATPRSRETKQTTLARRTPLERACYADRGCSAIHSPGKLELKANRTKPSIRDVSEWPFSAVFSPCGSCLIWRVVASTPRARRPARPPQPGPTDRGRSVPQQVGPVGPGRGCDGYDQTGG